MPASRDGNRPERMVRQEQRGRIPVAGGRPPGIERIEHHGVAGSIGHYVEDQRRVLLVDDPGASPTPRGSSALAALQDHFAARRSPGIAQGE